MYIIKKIKSEYHKRNIIYSHIYVKVSYSNTSIAQTNKYMLFYLPIIEHIKNKIRMQKFI